MTETDRLRAALRLCAVVVRHVEDDGCPHSSERCVPGEHPCDACRAAIYAATLALRAVAPDVAPRDAVLDWSGDATEGDPEIRARALAIVRDAGLDDPHAAAPNDVLQVASVEDLRPEYDFSGGERGKYAARRANSATPGDAPGEPDEPPTRCPTCGLTDPHTHVPMVSDGRGGWTPVGDPHAAEPGDVLAVAEVEDIGPLTAPERAAAMIRGIVGALTPPSPFEMVEVPAGLPIRCVCCERTTGPALGAMEGYPLCGECGERCVTHRTPTALLRAVKCRVVEDLRPDVPPASEHAVAFADAFRSRFPGSSAVVDRNTGAVETRVDGVRRRYMPDVEAVETLRRLVDEGAQRADIVAGLARWRA